MQIALFKSDFALLFLNRKCKLHLEILHVLKSFVNRFWVPQIAFLEHKILQIFQYFRRFAAKLCQIVTFRSNRRPQKQTLALFIVIFGDFGSLKMPNFFHFWIWSLHLLILKKVQITLWSPRKKTLLRRLKTVCGLYLKIVCRCLHIV